MATCTTPSTLCPQCTPLYPRVKAAHPTLTDTDLLKPADLYPVIFTQRQTGAEDPSLVEEIVEDLEQNASALFGAQVDVRAGMKKHEPGALGPDSPRTVEYFFLAELPYEVEISAEHMEDLFGSLTLPYRSWGVKVPTGCRMFCRLMFWDQMGGDPEMGRRRTVRVVVLLD